jgi:prepilin peptidase CpaA
VGFGVPLLGVLGALLAAACASDAMRRRVPNGIPVAVVVLGILAQAYASGARAAALGAGAALVLLALLVIPWRFGILGGGDVKLAAACAAWTGFPRMPLFVLATAVAGGALATALAIRHAHALSPTGPTSPSVGVGKVRIPYAFAVGAGALVALLWRFP